MSVVPVAPIVCGLVMTSVCLHPVCCALRSFIPTLSSRQINCCHEITGRPSWWQQQPSEFGLQGSICASYSLWLGIILRSPAKTRNFSGYMVIKFTFQQKQLGGSKTRFLAATHPVSPHCSWPRPGLRRVSVGPTSSPLDAASDSAPQ